VRREQKKDRNIYAAADIMAAVISPHRWSTGGDRVRVVYCAACTFALSTLSIVPSRKIVQLIKLIGEMQFAGIYLYPVRDVPRFRNPG
jgi:hypothetical protein